jgi:hypothetical protein
MKKNITAISILIIVIALVVLFLMNFNNSSNTEQPLNQSSIRFEAETISNGETIEYIFIPELIDKKDYLLTYELRKSGNIVDSLHEEVIKDVSLNNPIKINTLREVDSDYSLETIIKDVQNPSVELYNDKIVIYSQETKGTNNEDEQIEQGKTINFEKAGVIVINNPGFIADNWYLLYEEAGSPGLSVVLKFDENSLCLNSEKCSPEEFEAGTSVLIKGVQEDDSVLVKELVIR